MENKLSDPPKQKDDETALYSFTREQLANKMAGFNKWLSNTSMSNSNIPTHIKARMFIDQKLKHNQ